MIDNGFEEYLLNNKIQYAQGGEPILDCAGHSGMSPFYSRKSNMKTIASLITSDTMDGVYVVQLGADNFYYIIVKHGVLVRGSDVIVNKQLIDTICDELKGLEKIELTDVLVEKWSKMKKKWVKRNVLIFIFYFILSFILLVGVWLTIKVYLL